MSPLDSLVERIESCSRCPLRENATQPVPGIYLPHCKYFLIGEAPGSVEDKFGCCFIGPSGKKLDQLLAVAGIDPNQCSFDNTVKCRLPFTGTGRGKKARNPRKTEIRACVPFLWEAIKLCEPEFLVTLGSVPLSLFSEYGVRQLHGTMLEVDLDGNREKDKP